MTSDTVTTASRPPLWRDVRVLRIVGQLVFLAVVLFVAWGLYNNVRLNLRGAAIPTGFGYLDQPAGFNIRDSPFRPAERVQAAILVGLGNTLRVALLGIALATIWGTLLGIARLSTNWLVKTAAAFYVATVRNVPVLLWILFFFLAAVGQGLPADRLTIIEGGLIVSNRGVAIPWARAGEDGLGLLPLVVLIALVAAYVVAKWRRRVNDRTGAPLRTFRYALSVMLVILVGGYLLAGSPLEATYPVAEGLRVTGGIGIGGPYLALLLGLVVYTSSHIAEIVRGSIQAIHRGQSEAAQALALRGQQRMRYVILPQAMRIAAPPMASQYLNLTKNSSLAVAIAYVELTSVTTTIFSQGFPVLQSLLIAMLLYLTISLIISAVANVVNRRLQFVER